MKIFIEAKIFFIATIIFVIFVGQAFSGGKIITDKITSLALKDNKLGDTNIRDIVIYLPPSYDSSDKHYPVIYLLHGFGGNARSYVDEVTEQLMVTLIDLLIQTKALKELILVMPDGGNKYGGSFYLNSELIGNYEDYVAKELANHIDTKYRTIRDRDACAIAGASMGGYGSITLAMKHPDLYCSVASLSPPLGFEFMIDEIIPAILQENPDVLSGPRSRKDYTDKIYALSAALSPNLNNPPAFVDLPFEYPTGKVIEPIKQKWLENDPYTMLLKYSSSLKLMKGIYIDVGTNDLLGFKESADEFHKKLLELGIKHEYNVFEGEHADKGVERATTAITFLSNLLPDPEFHSSVKITGKLAYTWGALKSQP